VDLLAFLWDLVVHLDQHLEAFVAQHGAWVYALLFAIVFCETGLVVTPFLPGDSLIFVAGAVAAVGGMDPYVLCATLVAAALCGDNVNYWAGRWAGPKVLSRFLNPAHLRRAHDFYDRHGGKTIILARFVPIVRTFAPVVAGVAMMEYKRFVTYNVVGGFGWVWGLSLLGYLLGNIIPREWLEPAVLVIVFLSILPLIIEWWRHRNARAEAPTA